MDDNKWMYIRDMAALVCGTIAFGLLMHACMYCNAGRVP